MLLISHQSHSFMLVCKQFLVKLVLALAFVFLVVLTTKGSTSTNFIFKPYKPICHLFKIKNNNSKFYFIILLMCLRLNSYYGL